MAVSQSLTLTQSSQSVSGNYSKVRILWKSTQTGDSHNNNTRTAYYYVSINGGAETRYSVSYTLPKGSTKTIVDTTIQVNHKADGTGTVKVRTWMDTRISAGEVEQSKSLTLSTIPRATTPTLSASSVDMGGKVTITLNRAASGFTHDLAYSFNGAAYVGISTGVGTSYSWTVPDKASSIPNAASGTMTIRCITKNGSATIGTKTVNLTAKVPASVVPTISAVAATEATSGLAAQFGAFIQSKSKLAVQITAAGAKGSTIKSYKTTLDGKTYTAAAFTSGVLAGSGTLKMVTTVTDSRGRTDSKTTDVPVLAYTKPAIQILQVSRCAEDGTAKDDGNWVKVRYKYSLPALNGGNTARMTLEYKRHTAAEGDYETLLTGSAITADETVVPATVLTSDYSFDLRMTVKDYFNAADETTALLPSAEVILDIGADGKSLSIGGTAELPGFTTKWQMRTPGGRVPLVLPEGADLNAYTTPNTYAGIGATTAGYLNCPVTTATSFTLEVEAGGGSGQVMQRLTTCTKTAPRVWERFYYSNAWGEWLCISDFGNQILWTGAYYMTAGHTATLSAPVSAQPTGIVLVFSEFADGAAAEQSYHTRYVPKSLVVAAPGRGHTFQLTSSGLGYFATKYLHIYHDRIVGHENNSKTGTGACGIEYTNARFVLRYVIGV
jgi:hypothetical protein